MTLKAGGPVGVIGGGFSGSALAIALLERGASVVLIERSGVFGRGLAYSTTCERHLLNVRSGRMSLRPREPDHFVRWLSEQGLPADPESFAPRMHYGRYVADCLEAAAKASPGRLTRVIGEAFACETGEAGVTIRLARGESLSVAHVVLATGNPPPGGLRIPGLDAIGAAYVPDPWAADAFEGLAATADVFLIGAGLTAVDVLLKLEASGWSGKATAISRRGLLPRTHAPRAAEVEAAPAAGSERLSERLRQVRREARQAHWTTVLDRMRPQHQFLWRASSPAERKRFLRHLRAWWDVHRHRMAPEIGAQVERWIAEGRLVVGAGRLQHIETGRNGPEVIWRPRGGGEGRTPAARIVNCTGPQGDPSRVDSALTRSLLERGAVRVDPLALGLDTDAEGRIIDSNGRPQSWVSAMGPLTRGALWEIVAVPEIREQAQQMADRLTPRTEAPSRPGGPLAIFTAHPREQGETYLQHMGVAFRFGGKLVTAGAAALVHGVAPFLFRKTASRAICEMHAEMIRARRAPPPGS